MQSDRLQFGHYRVMRTLGRGATAKVKLAVDEDTGDYVALKIYRRTLVERFTIEVEALRLVSAHPNIVNVRNAVEKAEYWTRSGQERQVAYVELEYCAQGELIGYLLGRGALPEMCAKTCARHIVEAVEFMHSKGVAHRDLKPENILVTSTYQIKLADFGYAKLNDGPCHTHRGTKGYIAPEIIRREDYDGFKADVFALGVILYTLYTGRPPFTQAVPNDRFYAFVVSGRWGEFWVRNQRVEGTPIFSDDFKDLMQRLLALKPTERPSAMEILQHPWMTAGLAGPGQLEEWFRHGNNIEVTVAGSETHTQHYRALHLKWHDSTGTADESEVETGLEEPGLFRYASRTPDICPLGGPLAFTSNAHPDRLFEAVETWFQRKGALVAKDHRMYRMTMRVPGENSCLECSCSLLEDESQVKAEFHRLGGDVFLLLSLLRNLISELKHSE